MGFRFRKSIKIAPGVKLNVSKSGVSTSVGKRGASLNVGKRGARVTVGVPGSGISFSQQASAGGRKAKRKGGCGCLTIVALLVLVATAISSAGFMLA